MEETTVKRRRGRPTRAESAKIRAEKEKEIAKGQALEIPDDAKIDVLGPVKVPTLADPQYDPFNKDKTEPKKFHYRALNTRGHMLRKREAQGYQVVPGAKEYGDLILGRIPKEINDARAKVKAEKAKSMSRSVEERFKQEAERSGIEPLTKSDIQKFRK